MVAAREGGRWGDWDDTDAAARGGPTAETGCGEGDTGSREEDLGRRRTEEFRATVATG